MRTKVTLVLIFLNVALFFFIFKFERHWRTEAAFLESRRRVLGAETADIRSIAVRSAAAGGSYQLERKRDGWSLTSPLDWPANPNAVSSIISELQLLDHETSFGTKGLAKIGQSLADYGLDHPKLTVAFTSGDPAGPGGPPPPTILRIGDTSKDGNRAYLLSPDGATIHVVGRSLLDRLTQPLDQLRADSLLTVPVFEARSLRVETANPDQVRGTAGGGARVRIRRENSARWTFDTPITARASKAAVEVVIGQLNGMHPKTFNPPAPATLPSVAPALRVALEGNGRYETLFLGEPVPPAATPAPTPAPAPARPPAPATETEYYAQLENRSALFTVMVPNDLIEKLRNAPEKLRETRILDFDVPAVTSITLGSPAQPTAAPVTLQRLEIAANAAESGAWQVVRRGEGTQGPQTTAAERAAVQALLERLGQLAARAFVSDNPSSAELENWGFNRPEREITLTLARPAGGAVAPGGPAAAAANTTVVLRLGTDAARRVYARAGSATEPGSSIYAVDVNLARDFPVEASAWRDRTIPLVPANGRITALKFTELASQRVVLETALEAGGQPPAAAGAPNPEAVLKAVKLLPQLRARRFRAEPFSSEDRTWKFQLELKISLPGGTAAEQVETRTLFLSERQGGAEQLAGTKEAEFTFELEQPLLDALWPLLEGQRDPGPAPAPTK